MNINYSKLSKAQAKLDKYIGESKDIKMDKHQKDRKMALIVEFGELLNELHFLFRYWSNRQVDWDKALDEYSDGIHFLMTKGNDFGITEYEYDAPNVHDMQDLGFGIMNMMTILTKDNYKTLLDHYLLFGEKLGFTQKDIEAAYYFKNLENYKRQQAGY